MWPCRKVLCGKSFPCFGCIHSPPLNSARRALIAARTRNERLPDESARRLLRTFDTLWTICSDGIRLDQTSFPSAPLHGICVFSGWSESSSTSTVGGIDASSRTKRAPFTSSFTSSETVSHLIEVKIKMFFNSNFGLYIALATHVDSGERQQKLDEHQTSTFHAPISRKFLDGRSFFDFATRRERILYNYAYVPSTMSSTQPLCFRECGLRFHRRPDFRIRAGRGRQTCS